MDPSRAAVLAAIAAPSIRCGFTWIELSWSIHLQIWGETTRQIPATGAAVVCGGACGQSGAIAMGGHKTWLLLQKYLARFSLGVSPSSRRIGRSDRTLLGGFRTHRLQFPSEGGCKMPSLL